MSAPAKRGTIIIPPGTRSTDRLMGIWSMTPFLPSRDFAARAAARVPLGGGVEPEVDQRHQVAHRLRVGQHVEGKVAGPSVQVFEPKNEEDQVQRVHPEIVESVRVADGHAVPLQLGRQRVVNERLIGRVHGEAFLFVTWFFEAKRKRERPRRREISRSDPHDPLTASTSVPSLTSPPGFTRTCSPPRRPSTRSRSRPLSRPRTTATRCTAPLPSTV